jgi:hypothetical protein
MFFIATTFKSWKEITPEIWVLTQNNFSIVAKARKVCNIIIHDLKVVAIHYLSPLLLIAVAQDEKIMVSH